MRYTIKCEGCGYEMFTAKPNIWDKHRSMTDSFVGDTLTRTEKPTFYHYLVCTHERTGVSTLVRCPKEGKAFIHEYPEQETPKGAGDGR